MRKSPRYRRAGENNFSSLATMQTDMKLFFKVFPRFLEFCDKIVLRANTILVRGVTNDSGIRRTQVV